MIPAMGILISPSGPVDFDTTVPGSKSYTNRALIVAALAEGNSTLTNASLSEDSLLLVEALRTVGISIDVDPVERIFRVEGCGGSIPASQGDFFLGNAGTSLRFLTGFLSLGKGTYRIDGNERMRERPIRDLASGLEQLGCEVGWEGTEGCPPFTLKTGGRTGGVVHVSGATSSQYLSSLLLSAPLAEEKMEFRLKGELVSKPYIDMTSEVMSAFGVDIQEEEGTFTVAPSGYRGGSYRVESDAAAANYFFAMAAATAGRVRVTGLSLKSVQAEIRFLGVLQDMGCPVTSGEDWVEVKGAPLSGVDVDMNAFPDSVQTLAAIASFASGPTRIRNVANLRVKETDRIEAVTRELEKLGGKVDPSEDGLLIHPAELHGGKVHTYGDHRMAMSFAVTALHIEGIEIEDPNCVRKSFPGFFDQLELLLGR